MLTALKSIQPTIHSNIHVTTPRLYQYSSSVDTQILEDYPSSLELKNYMTKHTIPSADVARLGIALGSWLKKFHDWASEQVELGETMKKNQGMKKIKFWVNYGRLAATIKLFPTILERCRDMFREMEEKYKREAEEEDGELIHGDFWSGKYVLFNIPCAHFAPCIGRGQSLTGSSFLLRDGPIPSGPEPLKLVVIDWELSQLSSRAFDLGQCFAELFLLKHFRSIQAGSDMISAFMTGYGSLNEDMAFRVALHFGVHLIVWPCRVQGWGEGAIMEKCVEFGRDCCEHAWKKDKEWFRGGALGALFFPS